METDFRLIKKEHLRACYARIETHANVIGLHEDPRIYEALNRHIAKHVKENRHHIKKSYDKIGDKAKPPSMTNERWERHKKRWGSLKFIETSKKNQDTRLNCVKIIIQLEQPHSLSFAKRFLIRSLVELKAE